MKLFSRSTLPFLILILACLSFIPSTAQAKLALSKEIDQRMAKCLDKIEYTKYLQLQDEFRGMRNPGNVPISSKYKLNDVVKEDKGRLLCSVPGLPKWVSALCATRTIVDTCEGARKTKLRGRMGRMYAYYIRDHLIYYDQGNDPVPALPLPGEIRTDHGMKFEHDKLEEIERMFQDGVRDYYRTMRQLELKIVEYRNRCIEIPNLVGLTYDESLAVTVKKGFGASLIQQSQFSALNDYKDKAPLIIYKQEPQPGPDELRPKGFAIKIWVRNDLKSLKADPPSWLNARVGDSKSFVITAELLNGREVVTKVKDCKWFSTDTNVVDLTSAKGTVKATGPGKAEIRVLYDHHDGVKLASHVVRIPVTVLAPVKPPKPKRKLTSFKLTPPSVVDIAIGGPSIQLKGVATFSDQPKKKFDVTKRCKLWRSDGNPDLTVQGGLVTAHSAKLPQAKHVVHATYTYDGQTMKDLVQFRIIGSSSGSGKGGTTTPAIHYSKLTVNPADVTMELQSVESIRAKALYVKVPQSRIKDVTFDPDITWSSSNPSIAEFVNGVITSKMSVGTCVITATFNPPGVKKPLTAQCKVTVEKKPIVMDFEVLPKSGPYKPGDELTFIEKIKAPNKNDYDLTWYVEKGEVRKKRSILHTFKEPGKYTVRLVARHRKTGVDDAIAKSITIEQPPDVEVRIIFNPETNIYKVGSTVGFIAETKNDKAVTEYRWYVAGEYVDSGKTGVEYEFKEAGEFEIKLGLRMGSNFDEVSVTRMLIVGEAGIGVLGRVRNRFEARGAPEKLEIWSSYYKGGSGEWSKPIRFNGSNIGAVEKYIMYDGLQDAGWNTGFLVYVPGGRNEIQFKIFHFRWPENPRLGPSPRGIVHYSGRLPLHGKTVVPESIRFTREASRMCEVEWRTEDGSSCRARIGKFKKTNQDAVSGMKDLRCEEGVYPPIEDEDEDADVTDTGDGDGDGWDVDSDDDVVDDSIDDADDTGGTGGSTSDIDDSSNDDAGDDSGDLVDIDDLDEDDDGGSDDVVDLDDLDDDDDSDGDVDGDDDSDGGLTGGPGGGGDTDVSDDTGATGSGKKLDKDGSGAGSGGSVSSGFGDVPNVAGLWVDLNGHKVTIAQNGGTITMTARENKGPVGWKVAEGHVDGQSADGNFNGWALTANISDDANRITWSNRSVWKRIGSESDAASAGKKAQPNSLVGLWLSQDGHYLHIYKNGEWWEVEALENKGPVGWKKGTTGRFDGKRFSILINSRVNFADVAEDGGRIDWGQGNYWSLVNASPSAQDIDSHSFHSFNLAGSWVSQDGHKITLSQSGNKLTATALENKGPVGWKTAGGKVNFWDVSMLFGSRAHFAKVSDDGSRIDWGGGNYWSRKKPPSQGPTGPLIPYDKQGTNKLKITGYGIKKRK